MCLLLSVRLNAAVGAVVISLFAMLPNHILHNLFEYMTFIFHTKWFHFQNRCVCQRIILVLGVRTCVYLYVCVCTGYKPKGKYGRIKSVRANDLPSVVWAHTNICLFDAFKTIISLLGSCSFVSCCFPLWTTLQPIFENAVHSLYANLFEFEMAFWSFCPIIDLILRQINIHDTRNILPQTSIHTHTNLHNIHWPNSAN